MNQESAGAPAALVAMADELRQGKLQPAVTVRDLLKLFGAQRRADSIVGDIRATLSRLGLVTRPDFEHVWIEAPVELALSEGETASTDGTNPPTPRGSTPKSAPADPAFRSGQLAAANHSPARVTMQDSISEAITIMLQDDYSQLPIMQSDRDVKGIVTWKSIGTRMALHVDCGEVHHCREPHVEIASEESLFRAIPVIIENGYALVRGGDNRITGIVTESDLSSQFLVLSEPFAATWRCPEQSGHPLPAIEARPQRPTGAASNSGAVVPLLLVNEIEKHIRTIADGVFTLAELQSVKHPGGKKAIEKIADLTLGNWIHLLDDPERWSKLGISIDRKAFTNGLDRVRVIRNEVMHVNPDPLTTAEIQTLRSFAKFLRDMEGVMPARPPAAEK